MLIIDNLKKYLYDQEYYITIYDKYLHIFNYLKLNDFNDKTINLEMPSFILIIKGFDLFITKMSKNELLIKGNIISLEKTYE